MLYEGESNYEALSASVPVTVGLNKNKTGDNVSFNITISLALDGNNATFDTHYLVAAYNGKEIDIVNQKCSFTVSGDSTLEVTAKPYTPPYKLTVNADEGFKKITVYCFT